MPVTERTPIPYEEAIARILAHVPPPKPVEVPLAEAAGRVFLDTLVADFSLPPFRRSGADGFAIRSRDVERASRNGPFACASSRNSPRDGRTTHRLPRGRPCAS